MTERNFDRKFLRNLPFCVLKKGPHSLKPKIYTWRAQHSIADYQRLVDEWPLGDIKLILGEI